MFSTLRNHCIRDQKEDAPRGEYGHVALLLLGGRGKGHGGLDRSRKHLTLTENFSYI